MVRKSQRDRVARRAPSDHEGAYRREEVSGNWEGAKQPDGTESLIVLQKARRVPSGRESVGRSTQSS